MVIAMDMAASTVSQNEGSKKVGLGDLVMRVSLPFGESSNVSSSGRGTGS